MSRFPSAQHLSAWAGIAPGNYESGGKKLSTSTRKGNRVLRTVLVQAAHALARTKTYSSFEVYEVQIVLVHLKLE